MAIMMNIIEQNFKTNLHKKIRHLKHTTVQECDFILAFCCIVSRAGTDIDAALDQIQNLQVTKPVILVVLHHTFETEKIILDSNATINRKQILAVDCLFSEDDGLLQCQRNEDAVDKIAKYLKSQKLKSYACLKDDFADTNASPDQPTVQDDIQLIDSEPSIPWWRRKTFVWSVVVGSVVFVGGGIGLYFYLH